MIANAARVMMIRNAASASPPTSDDDARAKSRPRRPWRSAAIEVRASARCGTLAVRMRRAVIGTHYEKVRPNDVLIGYATAGCTLVLELPLDQFDCRSLFL